MSRRAIAVVVVAVAFVAAVVVSARRNPVYQSRALVSLGVVGETGVNSLDQNLALARGSTVHLTVQARHGPTASVHVAVVDGVALEFRSRSRHPAEASEAANAYARTYVELRRSQLADADVSVSAQAHSADRLRHLPHESAEPSVAVPARPARSPLPPWPSENWAVAGLAVIALALAIPGRDGDV